MSLFTPMDSMLFPFSLASSSSVARPPYGGFSGGHASVRIFHEVDGNREPLDGT